MADLDMTQAYYSVQTLYFAQRKILSSKFNIIETVEELRFKAIERYITIVEKSIALIQAYNESADKEVQAKVVDIRKNILIKIVASDNFSLNQLS